jgi:pyridoxine 5-phosphate synthase|tara:strand:- start:354 stop:1085 length:732 start_codon:yes stop_codon:yes gene_type:complete
MAKLSVNINKIATLRNARGENIPDLINSAIDIINFGADGITVHPRPDERHIKYNDVLELSNVLNKEFNIEGNPNIDFMKLVKDVKPTQVTLVPDSIEAITSNSGWNTKENFSFLKDTIEELKSYSIRTSVFVDPQLEMIEYAKKLSADRIELFTGQYAKLFSKDKEIAIKPYIECANLAEEIKIGVNAGHDLNQDNLKYFKDSINNLLEVSIGHALICESIYDGLEKTIKSYLDILNHENSSF